MSKRDGDFEIHVMSPDGTGLTNLTHSRWRSSGVRVLQSLNKTTKDYSLYTDSRSLVAADTLPAGASPYGVQDMAGNVAEWVADWYDAADYGSMELAVNPQGPSHGDNKVIRGGSYDPFSNILPSYF